MDTTIRRRLTPSQRDVLEDREQKRYDELFAEYEELAIAEYEMNFGPSPGYKPDGAKIDQLIKARMRKEQQEAA